ncbi:MAG: solute carrier family 23 protein [Adlercreutzia equolifaciens]
MLSFCPKFAAVISCMPACVIGGVSLVLYGMISAVGIRNLVENHVDFMLSRNVLITALILVLSLGIAYSAAGAIIVSGGRRDGGAARAWPWVRSVGIVLNIILPGRRPTSTTPGTEALCLAASEAEADDVPCPWKRK